MSDASTRKAWVPPRFVVTTAWRIHRGIYRLSRGRKGLWQPKPDKWGSMRLTTVGRRSGQERAVILGYYEDGPNLVTMAMNGWSDGEPAWWLNLQANPDGWVDIAGEPQRSIRGRAAVGEERDRLWDRWRHYDDNLDGFALLRSTETAVVVLEPRVPNVE